MPKPDNKTVTRRDSSSRYLYPLLIALLLAMAGIWFFLQASTPKPQALAPAPVAVTAKPAVVAPAQMVDEQQC